ncbi:MAG: DnaD domain protein [Clostridia bacterium]|nr:DnaD domain protein [Clostridia bacterium]
MKLNLMYGTGVIVLPASVYPAHMPPDASYLHVLIAVCANPSLLSDADMLYAAIAAQCHLPQALVQNAVAYWMNCGVLVQADAVGTVTAPGAAAEAVTAVSDTAAAAPAQQTTKQDKKPRAALPNYPAGETARIISETDGLRQALEECGRIAGKMFSEHENGQLAALYDTYGLSCEYLMMLFMYCRDIHGKTAVSYVVRTGIDLYNEGVCTVEALEAHIAAREKLRDIEYKIRRLLGLGERALTAKEKEYIATWTNVYAMPMDVITRAYEITVKNIDTPRMSYINKILSGWNENGIRTTEAVDAAEAEFERKKSGTAGNAPTGKSGQPASYDIDTFITLAMNRSFEDTD